MSFRRRALGPVICAAALTVLALGAVPAHAAFTTPIFQSMLNGAGDHQIGDPTGVAVDDATHSVYVADAMNHRIEKFDLQGNFILMFGDGVDQTSGGNVCTAASGHTCRAGQQTSATYPHFGYPRSLAVDNSNSPSHGDVYVADNGGDGSVSKFDSSGNLITSWGEGGRKFLYPTQMGVSSYTGYLWTLGGESCQFAIFDPQGSESLRFPQQWNCGRFDDIGVDENDNAYFASYGGNALKTYSQHELEGHGELGIISEGAANGYAINPANGDVLVDFGEEVIVFDKSCEPALGYCTQKDKFGSGTITGGEGIAVDSESGSVYVATNSGVAYFKPKVIPDVIPNGPPLAGHTDATLSQHLDPLGAGDISECKVEYGLSKNYGSTVPCNQPTPITSAADVTASLSGLTAESPYHYRFVATNGNGASKGPDQIVTPHWVKNLLTNEPTEVTPGGATLNGSLNPNGETTHYYFEWGTTTEYGNKTPAEPGSDPGTGMADVPVEVSLDGQLTSETTYHYRLVGYTNLGLSAGVDRSFTTPIAFLPTIQETSASKVGMSSAVVGGEVNPGFGDTSYMVQYGTNKNYELRTLVSPSIGDDGVFHSVSSELPELVPGTTYHYRIIAFNFKGTVQGSDATITTADIPTISGTSATVLGESSVRLSAQVIANGVSGNPSVHFDYGTTPGYGASTAEGPPLGLAGGSQDIDLSGLTPGTTYHYRAVASNPFGSATGPDQTFTTPPAPVAAGPSEPTACKKNQVRKKGKCVPKQHHKRHKHQKKQRHGAGA